MNQFTETFSVNELAASVIKAAQAVGLDASVRPIPNSRKEREQHYYNPAHSSLIELGLKPHCMTTEVLVDMLGRVQRHASHIDHARILPRVSWNSRSVA